MRKGRYGNDILECPSSCWNNGFPILRKSGSIRPPVFPLPSNPPPPTHTHVVRYIPTLSLRLVLAVLNSHRRFIFRLLASPAHSKLTGDRLSSPRKHDSTSARTRSQGNRSQLHPKPAPSHQRRAAPGARGRGSAAAPRALRRPRPCPAADPAFPRRGGAGPLLAPGSAHSAGAVSRSLGGSQRSAPAAAEWSGVCRPSFSASCCVGARSVRLCERPLARVAAAVGSSGECRRGRERPGARSTAPLGARLPRAGLETAVAGAAAGTAEGAARGDPFPLPGRASALPRLGTRAPGPRQVRDSGHLGAPRGRGWASAAPRPPPGARARYSLTARSRAPEAGSPNPGYLSAVRARLGAGGRGSRRGF